MLQVQGHGAPVCRDLVQGEENRLFQCAALGVVCRQGKVHAPLPQHPVGGGPALFRIHGDGVAAVCLYQLHAGHVGEPVADVDHVPEGDGALVLRREFVEPVVLRHVQHALVHPEEELGLAGVIHRHGGPDRHVMFVITEAGGIDLFEFPGNLRALNDLL